MKCPHCFGEDDKVVDSRAVRDGRAVCESIKSLDWGPNNAYTASRHWSTRLQEALAVEVEAQPEVRCSHPDGVVDEVEQHLVHRQIAFFSYATHDETVLMIIIIMMVVTDIEKAVSPKPVWLVDLEIKTN